MPPEVVGTGEGAAGAMLFPIFWSRAVMLDTSSALLSAHCGNPSLGETVALYLMHLNTEVIGAYPTTERSADHH